jgi:phosphatidylinositol glycan class U
VFIGVDLLLAFGLSRLATLQPTLEPITRLPDTTYDVPTKWSSASGFHWTPAQVAAFYLMNPLTILSCLARDVTLFERLFIVLSAVFAGQGLPQLN